MHRNLKNFLKLAAFFVPGALAVACSSSTTPAGTGASTSSSSSSTSTSTSSSSSSTGSASSSSSSTSTSTSSSSTSTSTSSSSTSTSSSSSGAAVTNACINTADGTIVTTEGAAELQSQVTACVLASQTPSDIVPCIQNKTKGDASTGLSAECAGCFAADGECGFANCAAPCTSTADGGAQQCSQCLVTNGCTPAFVTCSGIGASTDAGTD